MVDLDIHFISDASGEPTAVIVPIALWREIESERETAYLLKSEKLKRRLLESKQRQEGLSLEAIVEKLRIRLRGVRRSRLVGGIGSGTSATGYPSDPRHPARSLFRRWQTGAVEA